MKLRLIIHRKEKLLLCPNGSIMSADNETLTKLLTEFDKPNNFKGELGLWNNTTSEMESVTGKTLAYVDDTNNLIVYDASTFAEIISPSKFITVTEFSDKYGKKPAIIKRLCAEGRIEGAYKTSAGWLIPLDAEYPERKPRTSKNKGKHTINKVKHTNTLFITGLNCGRSNVKTLIT